MNSVRAQFGAMKASTAKVLLYFVFIGGARAIKTDVALHCNLSYPTVQQALAHLVANNLIMATEAFDEYTLTRQGAFFCSIPNYDEYPEAVEVEQETEGFIYFIQGGDLVKIGFAVDPTGRLQELQMGNPNPLKLLCAFPGNRSHEKLYHAHFENERVRGEWFKISTNLQNFVVDKEVQKTFLSTTTALIKETERQHQLQKEEEAKKIFLLASVGIGSPSKERLAKAEHCTIPYLEAHIGQWKKENKPVAILIHRLRSNDPAPTNSEDRERYVSGPFSEFIER